MRFRHSIRLLNTVAAATMLWLLSTAPSAAAPVDSARRLPRGSQVGLSIQKLVRQARLIRGPVARRFRLALFDLTNRTHALGRLTLPAPRDEDQVIQNDATTAPLSVRPLLSLRRLGFFIDTVEQRAFTRSLSPRSPRGPPTDV